MTSELGAKKKMFFQDYHAEGCIRELVLGFAQVGHLDGLSFRCKQRNGRPLNPEAPANSSEGQICLGGEFDT